uniref:MCD domain-containing protein n=1 Tax=Heterorhabditis bacteriophora TaxID=37862 RepID=A0A1I7XDI0_HETBA
MVIKDIPVYLTLTICNFVFPVIGKKVVDLYSSNDDSGKRNLLIAIGQECGVDKTALNNAISLYSKNSVMTHEVRAAATPMHFHLLQSIGNLPDGIKAELIRNETDRNSVSSLRRMEESARELLTIWFCQDNLKLERLTWESPGDILQKVAEYEAVHPVRGLVDFRKRVGSHRRLILLILLYIILSYLVFFLPNYISLCLGLAGIDLGNMLIKRVAGKLQSEVSSIRVHSTLSPIPGFRSWLLRCLHGNSEFGSVIDDYVLRLVSDVAGKKLTTEEANNMLMKVVSNQRTSIEQLDPLKDILLHICCRYLYTAKRNGYAVNSVANFHLRNGAELFRLNWRGDTSARGMEYSFGIMVNYRYRLDKVHENSAAYTLEKKISAHNQVLSLL